MFNILICLHLLNINYSHLINDSCNYVYLNICILFNLMAHFLWPLK